jgi:hypothetical protein
MDRYEWMAIAVLSLFLIPIGYVVRWVVVIIRSPKLPPLPPFETEAWNHKGQQLTITFRKGARPDQKVIDEIENNIDRYEGLIASHVAETEGNQTDFRKGLRLEGVSFPLYEDEQAEYDFSLNYVADDNSDMVFEAYFKDGKIEEVATGD